MISIFIQTTQEPEDKVRESLRLLSSAPIQTLIAKKWEIPEQIQVHFDRVVPLDVVILLATQQIDRLEFGGVRRWRDWPLPLRVLRRAQSVARWLCAGYMKRTPRVYDWLLGVRTIQSPKFYQYIEQLCMQFGLPSEHAMYLALELEKTVIPVSCTMKQRALRPPVPGQIRIECRCTIRSADAGESGEQH